MASKKEINWVLKEALKKEKWAEENCQKILDFAYLNGFTEVVIKIRNDEIRHQGLVKELINLLSYKEPGFIDKILNR